MAALFPTRDRKPHGLPGCWQGSGPRTLQLLLEFLTSQVQGLLWLQGEEERRLLLVSSRGSLAFWVFWGGAPDVHQHISAYLPFPVLKPAGSLSHLLLQLQIKKRSQGGILGSQRHWESSRCFSPRGVRNLYLACCLLSLLWSAPWHSGMHASLSSLRNSLRE